MIESSRISRLPPYLFATINKLKIEARREGKDIIDLGMGNPDQPPDKHIIEKLIEVVEKPKVHGYSTSRGIPNLRKAIMRRYEEKYGVKLDPEEEIIVVIGVKEGISHLFLAILNDGDMVLVPTPTYPSHFYHVAIAGGNLITIPLPDEEFFIPKLEEIVKKTYPQVKILILSFPHNPTTKTASLDFFKDVVSFAEKHNIIVIHDFAYADICFDGYKAPSFLQAKGAMKVGIEFYSISKTYNMAGWRVGFALGKKDVIRALVKLKSYYDYGVFTPIQIAAIEALNGPQEWVEKNVENYRVRRDTFVRGLKRLGLEVEPPKATMYVWVPLPEKFKSQGSLKFSIRLLEEGGVACSPGVGFGENGEGFLRFALVENEQRINQAIRGIKKVIEE